MGCIGIGLFGLHGRKAAQCQGGRAIACEGKEGALKRRDLAYILDFDPSLLRSTLTSTIGQGRIVLFSFEGNRAKGVKE